MNDAQQMQQSTENLDINLFVCLVELHESRMGKKEANRETNKAEYGIDSRALVKRPSA